MVPRVQKLCSIIPSVLDHVTEAPATSRWSDSKWGGCGPVPCFLLSHHGTENEQAPMPVAGQSCRISHVQDKDRAHCQKKNKQRHNYTSVSVPAWWEPSSQDPASQLPSFDRAARISSLCWSASSSWHWSHCFRDFIVMGGHWGEAEDAQMCLSRLQQMLPGAHTDLQLHSPLAEACYDTHSS